MMRWHLSTARAALVIGLFIWPQLASALDVPTVPTDLPILDQTTTLSVSERTNLGAKIAAERTQTGNQLAILIIPSLDGDALEDYAIRVARAWGIGEKDKNNGILLLVVKDDRKLRIEVGYGLEGALPDARASRIIRETITPAFRAGNYYRGIDAGLDAIIGAIHGENEASGGIDLNDPNVNWWDIGLFFLFIIPMWLGSILARSKSWWAGGVVGGIGGAIIGAIFGFVYVGIFAIIGLSLFGLLFDYVVSKNYHDNLGRHHAPSWWAGGRGFGGGGFGGFGGGGFGGGGSSGSW